VAVRPRFTGSIPHCVNVKVKRKNDAGGRSRENRRWGGKGSLA